MSETCPCGLGKPYSECCGRFHAGASLPPTAEALMRSRYTAYVLGLADYLLATWHTSTRPATLDLGGGTRPKWLGLKVLAHSQDDATHARVEFVARYKIGGRAHRMHELSRFLREDGRWFYLDGELREG